MIINDGNSKFEFEKLVTYAFEKSDCLMLEKRILYNENHIISRGEEILSRKLKILDIENMDNSRKCIDKIYLKFKDDKDIFDSNYIKKCENNIDCETKYLKRRDFIETLMRQITYSTSVAEFLNKYKKEIMYSKRIVNIFEDVESRNYTEKYFFKTSGEMKKFILKKGSFYDFCYPHCIENISFFKDGYCWLYSVSHEELCCIYPDSKEEYEYLRSIGIEFYDEDFILTPREQLYYEDYKENLK